MATYIDLTACEPPRHRPKRLPLLRLRRGRGWQRHRPGRVASILGGSWSEAQATYRHWLFWDGNRNSRIRCFHRRRALEKVIKAGGRLPLSTVLRCRIRYFTMRPCSAASLCRNASPRLPRRHRPTRNAPPFARSRQWPNGACLWPPCAPSAKTPSAKLCTTARKPIQRGRIYLSNSMAASKDQAGRLGLE